MPTDKDGTFALMKRDERDTLILEKFEGSRFENGGANLFDEHKASTIMKEAVSHAKKLADVLAPENEAVADEIVKSTMCCTNFVAKANAQVKTHKPPREVSMRILHAAIATPFDAINKVMARELLAVVKSIGNICDLCQHAALRCGYGQSDCFQY